VFAAGSVIVFPTTLPVNCDVSADDDPPSSAYVTVLLAGVHFAKRVKFALVEYASLTA
jgi:hypothetical protein